MEPNNHIVNSLLMGAGMFLGGYGTLPVRLPVAVMGGILAALVAWWVYQKTGSGLLALCLSAALMTHPYMFHYSQTARGYVPSALLSMVLLVLGERLLSNPRREVTALAWSAVTVATALNLVSSLLTWIAPLYASVLGLRAVEASRARAENAQERTTPELLIWIRVVALSALPIAVFLLTRLTSIQRAQAKWEIPWQGVAGYLEHARGILSYLFPGYWHAVLWVGLLCSALCIRSPGTRLCGVSVLLAFAACIGHSLIAGVFLFERVHGFYIVLSTVPLVALWRLPCPRLVQRTARALLVGFLVFLAVGNVRQNATGGVPIRYQTVAATVDRHVTQAEQEGRRVLTVLPAVWDEYLLSFLTRDSGLEHLDGAEPGTPLEVVLLSDMIETTHPRMVRCNYSDWGERLQYWEIPSSLATPGQAVLQSGFMSVWGVPAVVHRSAERIATHTTNAPNGAGLIGWRLPGHYDQVAQHVLRQASEALPALRWVSRPHQDDRQILVFFSTPSEYTALVDALGELEHIHGAERYDIVFLAE